MFLSATLFPDDQELGVAVRHPTLPAQRRLPGTAEVLHCARAGFLGPLSACVNAETWDFYTSGVFSRSRRGAEGTTTPVEADYADASSSLVQSSKNVPQQDTAESGHDRE